MSVPRRRKWNVENQLVITAHLSVNKNLHVIPGIILFVHSEQRGQIRGQKRQADVKTTIAEVLKIKGGEIQKGKKVVHRLVSQCTVFKFYNPL